MDLLDALKKSREDVNEKAPSSAAGLESSSAAPTPPPYIGSPSASNNAQDGRDSTWLGGGTIPPVAYTDLSRPPLPHRPVLPARKSSGSASASSRLNSLSQAPPASSLSPSSAGIEKKSRTPSPEKKGRMLRTLRPGGKEGRSSTGKLPNSMRARPPAAAKAATQAWGSSSGANLGLPSYASNSTCKDSLGVSQATASRSSFDRPGSGPDSERPSIEPQDHECFQSKSPFYFRSGDSSVTAYTAPRPEPRTNIDQSSNLLSTRKDHHATSPRHGSMESAQTKGGHASMLAYRNEYPTTTPDPRLTTSSAAVRSWNDPNIKKETHISRKPAPPPPRKAPSSSLNIQKSNSIPLLENLTIDTVEEDNYSPHTTRRKAGGKGPTARADLPPTPTSEAGEVTSYDAESDEWKERVRGIMKNLPRGVDETAAQQILNDIVIQGDEVHWDDVAGLDIAKSALKETVVYPFLRPDLFMGLREPARGMLLFGPPGTGKTMLARAVATESRSTFFAISASSLTSKFLGESEKLVRALFALAKMLAPSIIFVDEIDSLLSSRSSSGEHEATRRIKTEFLIQWSDLAKAAAGREQTEKDKERGDASRVLVLAATNLPWAIDEAARRRFVRRQYIPLPEDHVRKSQFKTLLSHQKHELDDIDMDQLVTLTDGFSGSDITALAKDAAMGPLRSLGEKLLHMTMDEIRPIRFEDFRASLKTIRPSVSKQGLKEFEDWAREFGERGG